MSIFEKLLAIQLEVRATKEQRNDFGKFNYRNAEQIYEAAKPVCQKHGVLLRLTDEVVEVAGKPYVKAVAEAIEIEPSGETYAIASCGWARIPDMKKGMDDSQITGSSSSYARKYALGGLLLLDDNKDPDSMDNRDSHDKEKAELKVKAMKENQKKLDEAENWRYISADHIDVKMSNGRWINLDECPLNWLEVLIRKDEFDGIKADIQKRIDLIKGAK